MLKILIEILMLKILIEILMLKILTEILMLKILIEPLFGDFPIRQHGIAKLTEDPIFAKSDLETCLVLI